METAIRGARPKLRATLDMAKPDDPLVINNP